MTSLMASVRISFVPIRIGMSPALAWYLHLDILQCAGFSREAKDGQFQIESRRRTGRTQTMMDVSEHADRSMVSCIKLNSLPGQGKTA